MANNNWTDHIKNHPLIAGLILVIVIGGGGFKLNDWFKENQRDKIESLQEENSKLHAENNRLEAGNKELESKLPLDTSSQAKQYNITVNDTLPLFQNQVLVHVTNAYEALGEADIEIISTLTTKPQKIKLTVDERVATFTHGEKKVTVSLVKVNDRGFESPTVDLAFTELR